MDEATQIPKEQIIAQKAVIKKDGKFLILRRTENETAFPGLWDFPGGKLEHGEDAIQSLAREVKEETGLAIQIKNAEGTYKSNLNDRPVKFVVYAVNVVSGDPEHVVLSEEHSEFRLATTEEILKLKTMPYLPKYLAAR
jgi:mutator protein MutT